MQATSSLRAPDSSSGNSEIQYSRDWLRVIGGMKPSGEPPFTVSLKTSTRSVITYFSSDASIERMVVGRM